MLKAHTNNTAGEVTLRSPDPRVPPAINFRYFDEGNDARGDDLKAVAAGIALARRLAAGLRKDGLDRRRRSARRRRAGRQAARVRPRTRVGPSRVVHVPHRPPEDGGVVSSDFKVHGVEGLRVVDASVFPRIPGFFIVSAVYMIGEKAADVISADAGGPR